MTDDPLSLVVHFDGSVRYGSENASPTAAAIGYVITAGEALVEGSRRLDTFVSSTHAEFRALLEGARAVAELSRHRRISDVHIRGDAATVLNAVDPLRPETPGDEIWKRRVALTRDALAPVPEVTYRRVSRGANERAQQLATRAYES